MITQQFRPSSPDQCSPPGISESKGMNPKLEIVVFLTSVKATLAAMDQAARLLKGLNGHISLVHFPTVPRQLALDSPPVSLDFTKERLLAIANESSVDTTAYLYLCRCPFEGLMSVLKPDALIIIGCPRRWWPTWETKLARKLQHAGYQVILQKSA